MGARMLKKPSSVEKESSAFLEDASKRLSRYLSKLKKNFNVKLVVLFGSIAKNSWLASTSDLDLLIAAEGLAETPAENYERLKWDGLVEPLAYNPPSLLRAVENLSFPILDALEEGRIIYADQQYLKELMETFRKVKEAYGLKKLKDGWSFKGKKSFKR